MTTELLQCWGIVENIAGTLGKHHANFSTTKMSGKACFVWTCLVAKIISNPANKYIVFLNHGY